MDDKEKGKPQIPSLRDSKKQEVKIKGLTSTMSLFDRFKQFKKKDLAFILSGLGVLFMAPLAEHFMMAPENGEATSAMKEGWGFKGPGQGGIGTGQSPYEPGVNGLAPGANTGAGSDVITPLNVRDPSALVMGPGASQQAPVSAPQPQQSAASKDSGGWKDALANAASRGAAAATKSASLPVPKIPLQGGLRGLGAVSGGGGGGYNLPPISASNVPNSASGSNSLSQVVTPTGYRGAAGARGSNNSNNGALENLKKAAAGAANEMNRGGGAASNLDNAAAASNFGTGAGNGGDGGFGDGAKDKGFGQNTNGNGRSQSEGLAFQLKKMRAEKDLELEYKIKEKKNLKLLAYDLRNKAAESIIMDGVIKPGTKWFAEGIFEGKFSPSKSKAVITCTGTGAVKNYPKSEGYCTDSSGNLGKKDKDGGCNNGSPIDKLCVERTIDDDGAAAPKENPPNVKPTGNEPLSDDGSGGDKRPRKAKEADPIKSVGPLLKQCQAVKPLREYGIAKSDDWKMADANPTASALVRAAATDLVASAQAALDAANALDAKQGGTANCDGAVDIVKGDNINRILNRSQDSLGRDGLSVLNDGSLTPTGEALQKVKDAEAAKHKSIGEQLAIMIAKAEEVETQTGIMQKKNQEMVEAQARKDLPAAAAAQQALGQAMQARAAAQTAWEAAKKSAQDTADTIATDAPDKAKPFADGESIRSSLANGKKSLDAAEPSLKSVGGYDGRAPSDPAAGSYLKAVETSLATAKTKLDSGKEQRDHLGKDASEVSGTLDSLSDAIKSSLDGDIGDSNKLERARYKAQATALYNGKDNKPKDSVTKTGNVIQDANDATVGQNDSYQSYGSNAKNDIGMAEPTKDSSSKANEQVNTLDGNVTKNIESVANGKKKVVDENQKLIDGLK